MSTVDSAPVAPESASRRTFLTSIAAVGGGLLVGFRVPLAQEQGSPTAALLSPNAFVRIDRSGQVTLVLPYVEMGQGAYTAQAQLLAEELELGLDQVRLEPAPPDEKLYSHPVFGDQITGGSGGLRGAWEPLRRAGASTRLLLINAAAQRWNVNPAECSAQRGAVVHARSGRRAEYAELLDAAACRPCRAGTIWCAFIAHAPRY